MRLLARLAVLAALAAGLCACTAPTAGVDVGDLGCGAMTLSSGGAGVTASVLDPQHIASVLSARTWADDLTGLESTEEVTAGIVSIRAVLARIEAFEPVDDDVETAFAQLEDGLRDGSVSSPAAGPIIRDLIDRMDVDVDASF